MKTFSLTFLEPGHKVLIVHRRLFEKDRPRFFAGVVDAFNENNGLLKVTGHTFGPARTGGISRKQDARTKILSLTSGTLMVYQLPAAADLARARIELDGRGTLWLTDGAALHMDLSEAHNENP